MILRAAFLIVLAAITSALTINEEECLNYTVYPVQYEITITPYVYTDRDSYFISEVLITVITYAPNVQMIELDAQGFDIQTVQVFHGTREIINRFRPFEYNAVTGKLYIYLQEPLRQYNVDKSQYSIRILYRKLLKNDGTGIVLVPYKDGQTTKYMVMTRLSPNKAKYFFPCFDNPRFESVFKFHVHMLSSKLGIESFNSSLVIAPLQTRDTTPDTATMLTYIPSPQVALHQVGFHLSQFGSSQVTAKNGQDTIVIWAPPQKLPFYDFILDFGQKIVDLIHVYASVQRPLTMGPINVVAVPSNVDGYEVGSWNLLTNGESRLAYVPEFTSIKQREKMTFELAQQLCRIWLGNPGEPETTRWKEEWFKEGVATYLAYYFIAQYEHGIHSMRYTWPIGVYGLKMKNLAMAEDWHHSTPSLASFNRTLAVEIPFRYKTLVTMKTASLLFMIENWLDSEKFHLALLKYVNTRRGGYLSLDDFLSNLDLDTVECQHQFFNGSTASRILKSWFYQSGYPVINVNVLRDRNPNAVQLKQRKFSYTRDSRGDSHYLIPISYVVQDKQNCYNCFQPRFTIDQTYTFEENLNGGWIILNRNGSAYYRVNYDTETWNLIAKALKEDRLSISEQNRAQIVNDVFALYAAGDMDQSLALEILSYLDEELSPIVWDSAVTGYELLKTERAGCNMTKHLYKDWQKFMGNRVAPIYKHLVNDIDQDRTTRMFRSNIINFACSIHYQPCLDDLRTVYKEYTSGKQRLDPDSREAYYYMIFQNSGNFDRHGFNTFEIEDKIIAQHRLAKENKFQYLIPVGSPIMDRLVMSTTSEPDTMTITEKIPVTPSAHDSASLSSITSIMSIVMAALIIAAVR